MLFPYLHSVLQTKRTRAAAAPCILQHMPHMATPARHASVWRAALGGILDKSMKLSIMVAYSANERPTQNLLPEVWSSSAKAADTRRSRYVSSEECVTCRPQSC